MAYRFNCVVNRKRGIITPGFHSLLYFLHIAVNFRLGHSDIFSSRCQPCNLGGTVFSRTRPVGAVFLKRIAVFTKPEFNLGSSAYPGKSEGNLHTILLDNPVFRIPCNTLYGSGKFPRAENNRTVGGCEIRSYGILRCRLKPFTLDCKRIALGQRIAHLYARYSRICAPCALY